MWFFGGAFGSSGAIFPEFSSFSIKTFVVVVVVVEVGGPAGATLILLFPSYTNTKNPTT